jgi:PhoPQ-activated pathogenicity-related protein
MLCRKSELREIALRFPEHVDRIEAWEELVTQAAKRGAATFFSTVNDPLNRMRKDAITPATHGIRNHIEWARTSYGGRQYQLDLQGDFGTACNEWGACG